MNQGYIHLYCGEGKGKTTCALGLALRACGRGKKVLWTSFLKDYDSGEFAHPPFDLLSGEKVSGFYKSMTQSQKDQVKSEARERLRLAFERSRDYFMLVLDEICACLSLNIIDEAELLCLLKNRPRSLEVVLTGRDPSPALIQACDYVSEIRCVKHPFDKGIPAREGIEF